MLWLVSYPTCPSNLSNISDFEISSISRQMHLFIAFPFSVTSIVWLVPQSYFVTPQNATFVSAGLFETRITFQANTLHYKNTELNHQWEQMCRDDLCILGVSSITPSFIIKLLITKTRYYVYGTWRHIVLDIKKAISVENNKTWVMYKTWINARNQEKQPPRFTKLTPNCHLKTST